MALGLGLALLATGLVGLGSAAASCASTSSGGLSMKGEDCKPIRKAKLVNGKAIAPESAPTRVKRVIKYANRIRKKPYIYGGGHGSFNDSGYDCSGAVSYALRGGKFLSSPMASTGFMNWAKRGKGNWITVYSNPSHAYIVIAGLRFDTAATTGNGPRWSKSLQSTSGSFSARHPGKY
ncbi:MAG: peptidoglycan endopeptidase [Solirubrobacterales bacterium]